MILPYTSLIQTNTYKFRRIDLTNASFDYPLSVGEEAIYFWYTYTSTNLPLRISTSEGVYEMIIIAPYQTTTDIYANLNPNNTTYSSAFTYSHVGWSDGGSSAGGISQTYSNFYLYFATSGGITVSYFTTYTNNKSNVFIQRNIRNYNGGGAVLIGGSRWNDTTIRWTSLGTLTTTTGNGLIIVLVRRLV